MLVTETIQENGSVTDNKPRCWKCNRVLGEYLTRPWSRRCQRCKSPNKRGRHAPSPSSLQNRGATLSPPQLTKVTLPLYA